MTPRTSQRRFSGRNSTGTIPIGLSRRQLLQAGGSLVGAAAASVVAPTWAFGGENALGRTVEIENLGPGNVAFPVIGGLFVPETETMYLGSRNLDPSRVVGFHVPSGEVAQTFTLGTGSFVMGLASGGPEVLYVGTGNGYPESAVNLYRCDQVTGEVTGLAAVPGIFNIQDLAVAPDGIVYIAGRPRGAPVLYSYDPASGDLTSIEVGEIGNAARTRALAATDTTVYFSLGSQLGGGGDQAALLALDRVTGALSDNLLPPEMRQDDEMINVEVFGDVLVIGTADQASESGGRTAVMNLDDGTWWVLDSYGREFIRDGDEIIAVNIDEILRLDLHTQTATQVLDFPPIPGSGVAWGLGLIDDLLVAGVAAGYVWTYDLASGEGQVYDLLESGATGDPQTGQSVGVVERSYAYVGGTGSVDLHDLAAGEVSKLYIPGEVKDMIPAGDVMYMGIYPRAEIWEHRPADDLPPRKVADLPGEQNRPHAVRWDDVNELLVLAVQSDTTGGGSLCVFDPITGAVTAHIDPLGNTVVQSVATGDGLAYIGGRNGDVAAWDPVAGEEVWRIPRPVGLDAVTGVAAIGHRLFGVTGTGIFFVIDLAGGPELVHQADLSSVARNARLVVNRGLIYGQSSTHFFRIFPFARYRPEVLADISGDWFSGPRLAVGDGNYHYTLDGRDLVRIRDRSPGA